MDKSTSTTATTVAAPVKKRKWYNVVSDELVSIGIFDTFDGVLMQDVQALSVLKKPGVKFKVYKELSDAFDAADQQAKKFSSGFFSRNLRPAVFRILTTERFLGTELKGGGEIFLDSSSIDTARHLNRDDVVYCYAPKESTLNCRLLRSRHHEEELRLAVLAAFTRYENLFISETRDGVVEGTICSSSQSSSDHGPAGLERARRFKDSLEGLEYLDLKKEIRSYVEGWLTGGFKKGRSFKAILYDVLVENYQLSAQLASPDKEQQIIPIGSILDVLRKVYNKIEKAVRHQEGCFLSQGPTRRY